MVDHPSDKARTLFLSYARADAAVARRNDVAPGAFGPCDTVTLGDFGPAEPTVNVDVFTSRATKLGTLFTLDA